MNLSEKQMLSIVNKAEQMADMIDQLPLFQICFAVAVILFVLKIIRNIRAEMDIRAGIAAKEACKYHRHLFHRKKKKAAYHKLKCEAYGVTAETTEAELLRLSKKAEPKSLQDIANLNSSYYRKEEK